MIDIQPLFYKSGKPSNERLEKLAKEFCDKEFGQGSVNLSDYQTIWVAVKGGAGEMPEAVGIECLTFSLDLPIHHTANGSKINDAAVSARLIKRLHEFLLDREFDGKNLLIHCAPENESLWKDFFDKMDARPADRMVLRVKPSVEV